jgi:hypothetical protein
MEETSVEFLFKRLSFYYPGMEKSHYSLFKKAKEMEREQRSQANNGNYCAVCGSIELWYDEELDSGIEDDEDEDDECDD